MGEEILRKKQNSHKKDYVDQESSSKHGPIKKNCPESFQSIYNAIVIAIELRKTVVLMKSKV